jgi:hypothetical protein
MKQTIAMTILCTAFYGMMIFFIWAVWPMSLAFIGILLVIGVLGWATANID